MDEDIRQDVQEDQEQPQYTEQEQEALSKGWLPPDKAEEKGVAKGDIVSAEAFLHAEKWDKQLKIEKQRNQALAQKLDRIMSRWDKAESKGYERALEELKAQRDAAYDEMDTAAARQIDKQIEETQSEYEQLKQEQQQAQVSQVPKEAVQEFINKNKDWLNVDPAATQFADATYRTLTAQGVDPETALDETQKRVDAFRGVTPAKSNKEKTSFVAPPSRGKPASGKASYSERDLTPDAQSIYRSMKQYKKDNFNMDYTVNDFIKAHKDVGDDLSELVRG